jgi:methylphosphotriester-DNA--protein-cysteine methyltransferase
MTNLRRTIAAMLLLAGLLCFQPVHAAQQFVGNTKSHVFHKLTCRYAGCQHCTKVFKSRDEAIAAGYRPGGCCHP